MAAWRPGFRGLLQRNEAATFWCGQLLLIYNRMTAPKSGGLVSLGGAMKTGLKAATWPPHAVIRYVVAKFSLAEWSSALAGRSWSIVGCPRSTRGRRQQLSLRTNVYFEADAQVSVSLASLLTGGLFRVNPLYSRESRFRLPSPSAKVHLAEAGLLRSSFRARKTASKFGLV